MQFLENKYVLQFLSNSEPDFSEESEAFFFVIAEILHFSFTLDWDSRHSNIGRISSIFYQAYPEIVNPLLSREELERFHDFWKQPDPMSFVCQVEPHSYYTATSIISRLSFAGRRKVAIFLQVISLAVTEQLFQGRSYNRQLCCIYFGDVLKLVWYDLPSQDLII